MLINTRGLSARWSLYARLASLALILIAFWAIAVFILAERYDAADSHLNDPYVIQMAEIRRKVGFFHSDLPDLQKIK